MCKVIKKVLKNFTSMLIKQKRQQSNAYEKNFKVNEAKYQYTCVINRVYKYI